MKIKVISILIIIFFVLGNIVATANVSNRKIQKNDYLGEIIPIRVAVYTDEKETLEEYYAPQGRSRYFLYALSDYSWKAGDNHYVFVPDILSTEDILKGKLTKENYDVLLYTPCQGDEQLFFTGWPNLPNNRLRVRNIKKFIESGGGYYGTCAGAQVASNMKNMPKTFFELMQKRSCLGISVTQFEFKMAIPIFCQLFGSGIERIDDNGYIQYSGWNQTDLFLNYHSGVCLNSPVNHNNPIFDDLLEDARLIRWVSGPALEIPENVDRDIQVLTWYPAEEISDNESTRIHHWKYTGGLRGLINAAINGKGDIHYWENLGIFMKAFVFASDWEMTDKIVETNLSNKPSMTAEIYPNENEARILITGLHPEMNVWWDGHIEELEDNGNNTIYEAFHRWVNVTAEHETPGDEFSYNYWMVRRSVAWASQKVDDNCLPPLYGPSEVCDFDNNVNAINFTVTGNCEKSEGNVYVDLYYSYSSDNETWSDWTFYDTDLLDYDDLSWTFNSSNGTGYYQFYSIRRVENEGFVETEKSPLGADSIVFVEDE